MGGRIPRLAVAALTVLGLMLPAMPASSAERGTALDADDVDGRLDLAKLRFYKPGKKSHIVITVKTYEPWGKRALRLNVNKLVVLLDVDRDGSRDYRARIRKAGKKLIVIISGSGENFEPLPARKPNRRTVRFVIPGDSPPNPVGPAPNMAARSKFIEEHACDPGSGSPPCIDRAPDSGWL